MFMLLATSWKAATRLVMLAVLALVCGVSGSAAAADKFVWTNPTNLVTAEISSSSLLPVLEKIAKATRWNVYVEPGTDHRVSAKFKDLPAGEALRLLLGDLNFALIPSSNGSSRLFVFKTARDNATLIVAPARDPQEGKAKLIANELIVRLKPGANIDALAQLVGAKVVGRIDALNAYRLRFDDEAAANAARETLNHNSDVAAVDSNYSWDRPEGARTLASSLGPPQLQLRPPPESGRVIIGLVDTAVQSLGDLDKFVLKSLSVAGKATSDPSEPTHGTTMLGTILRALQAQTQGNTSVQILPVDVYGPNASTSTFEVAAGIILARNHGAQIINLSLGSEGDSPFLRDTVTEVNRTDVVLIAAKGNQPTTTPFYPAAFEGVLAVTATEQGGQLAPYANLADIPTVGAPGNSIVYFHGLNFLSSGTSVAAANVSGIAAGFMEVNRKGVAEARAFIRSNLSVPGKK